MQVKEKEDIALTLKNNLLYYPDFMIEYSTKFDSNNWDSFKIFLNGFSRVYPYVTG